MIAGPLIQVWADAYAIHSPASLVKYKGSNPAAGIKSVINKEADFSCLDMPLTPAELKANGLTQFPFALSGIAPVVNLPNVYPGQLRLDGKTLADIFLGNITRWDDPAIVSLNPSVKLPEANIIVVHRASPPGISTIIGDYLAKIHPQWKALKGDGMAGNWPASAIEVKDPIQGAATIKKPSYSIGYLAVPQIMKNGLTYVQLQNKAGKFVSPSDENISAAAEGANWDSATGMSVILTDQPGESSWPLAMASFALLRKTADQPERSVEVLKYFKYNLRYGGLRAVQQDYIPLPETVKVKVRASWADIVDSKGEPLFKD
jgi:phosphate transport system substrate-binding protein